jgi:plastocyanin
LPALLLTLAAGTTHAADLAVTVTDARSTTAQQAVVLARPVHPLTAHPAAAAKARVVQESQAFAPEVTPIAVGTTVEFPNLDRMRHHVYSFSPANTFEIRLYSGEDIPEVTFDKPGVVAIGCNIHDWMQGYLYVTDAPYFAATDASGVATLHGLPAGEYRVSVWHPELASEFAGPNASVGSASGALTVKLDANIEPLSQHRPDDDPLLARFHELHK